MPLETPYLLSRDIVADGYVFRIINTDTGLALHTEKTNNPVPSKYFKDLWEEIIEPYV